MPMSGAGEGTSPIAPKQHKPWRPIDEAAYRWSKNRREREENDGGGEHMNQSHTTPQKRLSCQQPLSYSSSVKHSVESDYSSLFSENYDLNAPFEENIRMLNDRKRPKDGNPSIGVSDGSPSRKRPRTTKQPKARGDEKALGYRQHEYDQPVSQTISNSKKKKSNMEAPHQSPDTSAYDKQSLANSPTSKAAKAAEPAFDPPQAPRAHFLFKGSSSHVQSMETDSNRSRHFQGSTADNGHGPVKTRQGSDSSVSKPVSTASSAVHAVPQNAAPDEDGNRSAKATLEGCSCNLPSFFSAHHHKIPKLKNWTGEKEEFFRHVRSIANCKFHPSDVKGACRNIVKSHEAGLSRKNEAQLFSTTDLSKGIFSNGNGRYVVDRGRSQSTIAPDNFYVSARNANKGEPAEVLGLKADFSNVSVASQQRTPTSLSPDRARKGSPNVSDYKCHRTPFAGPSKSRSVANGTSSFSVASRQNSVPSDYQQESQSFSRCYSDRDSPNTPKMGSWSKAREGIGEKEVEGVIDWAMDCLERQLASSNSPQSMIQDGGPIEDDSSTQVSPRKQDQPLRRQSSPDFARKAKRHQSLPARLTTPAPAAIKPAQTPGDRVKAFAKEHLAKVPNLSLLDIKRVVEELDRRLTDIEADKEAARTMRSSERPKVVTPSNIIHYSSSRGFTDETSASTSGASADASSSALAAAPASGFVPINQPVSNTRGLTNAMPPPPLPHKPKSKTIAQQKMEKPELSADVPVDQRLPRHHPAGPAEVCLPSPRRCTLCFQLPRQATQRLSLPSHQGRSRRQNGLDRRGRSPDSLETGLS